MSLKELKLRGRELNRQEMKHVVGGSGPVSLPKCFRCCPDDSCSPRPHICPDHACGPVN